MTRVTVDPGWYWVKFPDNNAWEPAEYLSNGNWCLLGEDDEASAIEVGPHILFPGEPNRIRALTSPEKITEPTPAKFTRDAFENYLAMKRGATPPAASDLRERAQQVVDDWIGDSTGWVDAELKELQDIIYEQLAAIRVEAKAEGWEDAVKALREMWRKRTWDGDCWIADWLATNRPSPAGRES